MPVMRYIRQRHVTYMPDAVSSPCFDALRAAAARCLLHAYASAVAGALLP